ncbi:hypothetical protein K432DRAFT_428019 [Lepidopterella palustris CBS 459.81]|uniref:JmjC domain-containing protein n=1 Tax=Lepidopterella palustris CBS 459.81 TaxID=1314670 RepID=A0A8E2E584_9PEZI|nr:hypothetical protein K432DRAFT_428019 [Lepidopterella palustris CBS 459.81]
MPAQRPRASFEPIPPDFDLRTFVENADNFQYVDRISWEMVVQQGIEQFEKLVLLHVIIGGKPLVIDGFDEVLDPWTFTSQWLKDNHGDKIENARNLTAKNNLPLTLKHYLTNMGRLTEQYFASPENYRDKSRQRIYLKDIDCPPVWQDKLKEHIPAGLFYLNESSGEIGGPGSVEEPVLNATGTRKGRGIARAGDLMSSLPPDMRAENLMCYIGHEGTYTPAHREMCASLGHNIMVEASGTVGEDGKPERPGSSIWFMTETKDRQVVSEYWLSILGHDIEVENHFAQLIAWKRAPFKTYVVEQRPGDFILIPPLAPHQVWNRGTRTMKVAWNRTTVETLEMAINEALPNARMVCRDEQYKNKAIVYYSLLKYSGLLKSARAQVELGGEQALALMSSVKVRQVQRDFKRLFDLYKTIMLSEMFAPDSREHPEFIPYDSNVTCAYCRCNIFNRFLTCKTCTTALDTEDEEPYDVCMECYAMGRSCACQSNLQWVEQWKWKDLLHKYEEWRMQVIEIDGGVTDKTPLPLSEERRYLGKKTLAKVCQEQLKIRPWVSITLEKPEEDSEEEEIQVTEDGMVKKTVKKRSKQWLNTHKSCHFCLHRHPKWKMAACTNCDYSYCYGTLFRAHDLMPLTVMEMQNWKCPHCLRKCNTGNCRRDPRQNPYEPKGTLLGHDTRKVADARSVECLVDFSVSNLNWLREDIDAPLDSVRLKRRKEEAERAKQNDPTLDDRYADEEQGTRGHTIRNGIEYSPVEDTNGASGFHDGLIDPSLRGDESGGFDLPYTQQQGSFLQKCDEPPNGYVGPSAVMHGYQPDDPMEDDEIVSSFYPDPSGEIPRISKKRARQPDNDEQVKLVGKKKRRKSDEIHDQEPKPKEPKSGATKQFQKEQDKKKLEEARKSGRYIMVAAAMRKKSRVVTLSISNEKLAIFEAQQAAKQAMVHGFGADGAVDDTRAIIQSDVLPVSKGTPNMGAKPNKPNQFRYRVEEDDDFRSKSRRKGVNGVNSNPRPKGKHRYEEITVDSDEEQEQDDEDEDYTGMAGNRSGKKRRISSWLGRKNQEDGDLPTELPPNFKDGDVHPRRAERRKTMPVPKPKAQVRPPVPRPVRASTGNISDEDGDYEDDDTLRAGAKAPSASVQVAQSAAAASRREEEKKAAQENVNAKLMAAKWANGDESDDGSLDAYIDAVASQQLPAVSPELSTPAVTTSAVPSPRPGPPKSNSSIMSCPGMAGKNIKIVSAASRQNQGTPKASTSTTKVVVNSTANGARKPGKPTVVQLSDDSDSEDEIPAKLPAPASKPVGRPVGRPSLSSLPGSAKRGRGRPPKNRLST